MDNNMRNKTNTTTNNIKGDDVEMNKGLELITITNSEGKEIRVDEGLLEMAIKNGVTIDEVFERSNMTLKEISESIKKTNEKLKQSLEDMEKKDKTLNDTLRRSEETLAAIQPEATERIDKLAKIKKADGVLEVVAAFLVGSLSTSILYGIINLLF